VSIKALVIGYGSIGKRHADILSKLGVFKNVSVLSRQTGLPYETINDLAEISNLNPDYVVIASPTSLHHEHLKFLEDNLEGRKILVEKPLFGSKIDQEIQHNQVFVGYNLRFHPLLQKLKDYIKNRKLWNINVFCGSYLPEWRTGRDYRQTSSAMQDLGGGVLLDLSHELDYLQWLLGPIEVDHAVSKKVSDLEIDSDDLLLLSGKNGKGIHVHVTLNYFTRKSLRRILVDGEGISIQGDLISNKLDVIEDGRESNFTWPTLGKNDTYKDLHLAVLEGVDSKVCTFEEGLEVMRLIDKIRFFEEL